MIEVIPGIFEKDIHRITERATLVSPYVDWIHIDIADGKLVPNTSFFDSTHFNNLIKQSGKKFELHMMVDDPLTISDSWVGVGFKRLLWHIESSDISKLKTHHFAKASRGKQNSKLQRKIQNYKSKVEIGLAIDKDTSIEEVFPYLDSIDCVLIMTIKAGFSGQEFIPEMLEKVRAVRARKPTLPIEIDGGINDETAKLAVAAGATRLVSTSTIFSAGNIEEAIERLKSETRNPKS